MPDRFEWDCRTEHDELDQPPEILAIAIDRNGRLHLFCAACLVDPIQNPGVYESERLVLHGTHFLSTDLQRELFPADFE